MEETSTLGMLGPVWSNQELSLALGRLEREVPRGIRTSLYLWLHAGLQGPPACC